MSFLPSTCFLVWACAISMLAAGTQGCGQGVTSAFVDTVETSACGNWCALLVRQGLYVGPPWGVGALTALLDLWIVQGLLFSGVEAVHLLYLATPGRNPSKGKPWGTLVSFFCCVPLTSSELPAP